VNDLGERTGVSGPSLGVPKTRPAYARPFAGRNIVDRFWLLTWRTYGTWLPGDERGSITRVRDGDGPRVEHDVVGTFMDGPMRGLELSARNAMKGPPILLSYEQAVQVAEQFQETARHRTWSILAGAVMSNHVHLVIAVLGDPDPGKMLVDFKAWGTRRLNARWGKRPNGSWWSEGGSKRKLPNEDAIFGAVNYVWRQAGALRVWVAEGWEPKQQSNGPA
jgi:REP element-mobilizing transposase RayT